MITEIMIVMIVITLMMTMMTIIMMASANKFTKEQKVQYSTTHHTIRVSTQSTATHSHLVVACVG